MSDYCLLNVKSVQQGTAEGITNELLFINIFNPFFSIFRFLKTQLSLFLARYQASALSSHHRLACQFDHTVQELSSNHYCIQQFICAIISLSYNLLSLLKIGQVALVVNTNITLLCYCTTVLGILLNCV